MHRRDRGLQRVRTEAPRRERPLDQRRPFRDLRAIPQRAILIVEQHDFAVRRRARRAPRLVQEHQRQQSHRFGLGQQLDDQPAEANRFGRQVVARQRLPRRGRVPFVEDQVDHVQDAVESIGQIGARRDLVRDPRVADLPLGADDALRDGRRRAEERARDLLGRQAADLAQRQRDPRVRRERRMAAGEDEAQPIVLHDVLLDRPVGGRRHAALRASRRSASSPSDASNRAPAPIRSIALKRPAETSQVRGLAGHAVPRPLLHGRGEGVVQRLLGEIEVAEEADERRENAAGLGSVDRVHRVAHARLLD